MARNRLRDQFTCLCKTKRFKIFKDQQLKKQRGECYYCNKIFNPQIHIEVDHVIPLSKNGTNNFNNLVLSCQTCNLEKGAKLISEWLDPKEIFYGN